MMTGPIKAERERIAATQRPRTKPLERRNTWRMLAGIGVALVIGGSMLACVLFSTLGTIGH